MFDPVIRYMYVGPLNLILLPTLKIAETIVMRYENQEMVDPAGFEPATSAV